MFKKIFLSLMVVVSCFLFASFSLAQSNTNNPEEETNPASLDNPINAESFQAVIGNVVDQILGIVGALALLMFIFGGLVWMTAAGNEQKITQGKNILMWSAIGLLVIFSSYALVKFVLEVIGA
jgi:hypothetical protein